MREQAQEREGHRAGHRDAATSGIDEGRLFETLCELTADARARELARLDAEAPALAARLRRLLAIDEAYGTHTARSVMPHELADPVDGINDIGPFRLLQRIGRGGMGVVYLAERRSGFSQQVALKIMPRFAGDDAGRERFARERRILAQLRHPNICTILDGGELPDGTPWLAMEYVPGETLCAWSAARGLDLRARVALFLQLCDAVQYAHRNLVVHRDLKDSNVLVDDAGHLKLLDFGIARSLAPSADGHTLAQDAFFSPMTAAPEQIRGERVSVGADVHALGALLHQLLAGHLPFEAAKLPPLALQRAILEIVPPRMSDVTAPGAIAAEALRGDLDAIVAHCLRKDPSERYAGVGELARDLRAWQSGHPISIARDDRVYRLRKFLRRHRLPAALATITAAGVLVALAVTLWQAAELRTQRDAADAARQRSEIDRDRARAVAAFVHDIFEEANPGSAQVGGLLARDLIERGKHRLGTLRTQPDVQAELALLLAESDAALGLVEESQGTLDRYGAGIERLAVVDRAVRWRARALRLSNRLDTAADGPALDAALADLRALADTSARQVQAARLQERLHARRSQFGAGARTLEDAWRRHGSALPPAEALRLRVKLGHALLNADRTADADRIVDALARETLDAYEPALQIGALRLILRVLRERKDARAAQAQAALRLQEAAVRLYGADSLEAAMAYVYRVGAIHDAREQDALMTKAYAIQMAKLGPVSIGRAYAEYNMGEYQASLRGRPDQAEPHFARAVGIGRRVASRAHADVLTFELAWARTLNALGRHRACLDALSDPPDAPEDLADAERLGALRLALAEAARALGQPARARAELDAIRALWRRIDAPIPPALDDRLRAMDTMR
ncbi:MAG: serine/threonine protein kinase [Lysobacter sp.]|nr:serine/threonine protein kinase [Lysobacter sp.]